MTPSVSVIMPVGGVDRYLPLQLDALQRQRHAERWELVISLNSGEPGERSSLRALLASRRSLPARVVVADEARSASYARNVGATAASADRLVFCDGDDIADGDWLREIVAALDGAEAVGGHLAEELLAIPGQYRWRPPATPGALPTFLGHPYLVSANMGLRRAAFELVGGFDTDLVRGEDIALSWELTDRGIELAYAPKAIVHYRHRQGLVPMMKQHYLYGRGFSQLLARRGVPGAGSTTGLRALRPNGQPVAHKGLVHLLRRGSIATGRLVGLIEQRRADRLLTGP